jgi:ABC-2 type transport system ATP-binding protein
MTETIVRATGVTKSYGSTRVLTGVDLDVRRGTVFALLGPNGAGKTTLIRILSTLIRADSGEASVAGHDVLRAPDRVRRSISLTGQYAAVDELLTGEENMLMMGRLCHLSRRDAKRRCSELLDRFDLADARRRRVKTYSGGMRRRLDLAVSLVGRPPVIFLDEPTTGLDPRSRQSMWAAARELVDAGVTILLTTQYLEEADQLADRIALIDGGRVVAEGTAEELKWQLAGEQVELVLADDRQFAAAGAELGREAVHADADRRALRVATDGSAKQLKHLLDRMERQGVTVARVALRRPSLDDVFLALTGDTAAEVGA